MRPGCARWRRSDAPGSAHTGGYNVDSLGVSLIGTYSTVSPDHAMLQALEKLLAWRLADYYRDPTGRASLLALPYDGSRYPAGTTVGLNVISGHRDADYTTCPGAKAYHDLPSVRSAVRARIGAALVAPHVVGATTWRLGGSGSIAMRAVALRRESWQLTVTDAAGDVVSSTSGTAASYHPIDAVWDRTLTDGDPAPVGTYDVTLAASDGPQTGKPFTEVVHVLEPVTVHGPTTAGYGQRVTLTGAVAPRGRVTVTIGGIATVVTGSTHGTWRAGFVEAADQTWSAAADGYSTGLHTTTLVPLVTSPEPVSDRLFVATAASTTLEGTAPPGQTVTVLTPGSATAALTVAVDATGRWSTSYPASGSSRLQVVIGTGGPSTPTYRLWPVGPLSAHGPRSVVRGHRLSIRGDAGGAPAPVELEVRRNGAADFHVAARATASGSGHYTVGVRHLHNGIAWRILVVDGPDVVARTGVRHVRIRR
jgi:hypothetical protein